MHKQKSSNDLKDNNLQPKNDDNSIQERPRNDTRHVPQLRPRLQPLTSSNEAISPPQARRETGGSPMPLSPESPSPSVPESPPSISVTPAVSSQPSYTYVSSLESHGRPESISISSNRSSIVMYVIYLLLTWNK